MAVNAVGQDSDIQDLVARHHGLVFALALARLRDRDAAEDLAQEVFLRAFVQLDRSRGPEGRLAWLICVTRNLATDWQRRNQTGSRLVREVSARFCPQSGPMAPPAQNPRERLMQREKDEALDEAMEALPVEQRELVLLHYMEGIPRRDIAAKLGVHPATVGRRLDAALAQLRAALEPALRQHLSATRPGSPAITRAGLVVTAFAAASSAAKAEVIAGAAWTQADAVVAEAVRALANASAASSGSGTGASLMTTATTAAKGAIIMAKGKVAGGIIVGSLLAGTAGVVGYNRYYEHLHTIPVNSTVTGIVPKTQQAAGVLPALPSGWKLEVTPHKPRTVIEALSKKGAYDFRGIDMANALNYWGTVARVIDPAFKPNENRYDVKLTGPAGVTDDDMNAVMRTEMQRLFGFRATMEKRKTACLVLRAPTGKPTDFKPSAGNSSLVRSQDGVIQMRNTTMKGFVRNMSLNRQIPIFDETGLDGKYDVDLPMPGGNYREAYSDASMAKLGFQVVQEERESEVLFVSPD
ncbi:MAG: TIGR03435 family protein [Candidatus Sumerlaeaceae bacterium]|nr:TIGR03435 family protein [Candidatus Sumerlaeaceae bacterium]